ncbi:MAG: hypothetical protein LBB12_00185 [Holosporaceae bacterium]|jgi:hypothetical protein|nr:hypothetical protein [Holosporaceae bacterium]
MLPAQEDLSSGSDEVDGEEKSLCRGFLDNKLLDVNQSLVYILGGIDDGVEGRCNEDVTSC